jgi:hypothetical protein
MYDMFSDEAGPAMPVVPKGGRAQAEDWEDAEGYYRT